MITVGNPLDNNDDYSTKYLHGCPRWGGCLPVGHSERGHRRVAEGGENYQHGKSKGLQEKRET